MSKQVLQFRDNEPPAFSRCAAKLLVQPALARVQYPDIKISSELLADCVIVRVPHHCIGSIRRLPSRAMHARHYQCVLTEDDIRRESADAHQRLAPICSERIREEDRFETHCAPAFPATHYGRIRIAEMSAVRFDRARLLSWKLTPICSANFWILERPHQVRECLSSIRRRILRQVNENARIRRMVCTHLAGPAVIELSRWNLQHFKSIPPRQLCRTIFGGRINDDYAVGL